MELNQIRYFLNLADTLNFTEAAMRSGVSQPTLTRAISGSNKSWAEHWFIAMERIVDLQRLAATYDPNSLPSRTASSGFGRYPSIGFAAGTKL